MTHPSEPADGLPEPARALPPGAQPYKRTPEFTEETISAGLLKAHATKDGVWGRICVTSGELVYAVTDDRRRARELVLSPGDDGIVEPTILHHVRATGPVVFFVEFWRENMPKA